MDPVSQGLLGAALPMTLANRNEVRAAGLVGALAGMAPDLDILIRSSKDPLLHLEYHRHFTHSLFFVPFGSLLVALVLWPMIRKWEIDFGRYYWFSFLGFLTHAPLDACTSYGTRLLWPFAETRFAWNNVSVIDPFLTIPLGLFVLACLARKRAIIALVGFVFVLVYLLFGAFQNRQARLLLQAYAAMNGHIASRLEVKPTLFNPLLFRGIYKHGNTYYLCGVRNGIFGKDQLYPGGSIQAFDMKRDYPNLSADSLQARDIERFRFFSDDYLVHVKGQENAVGDLRYAMLPQSVKPLWGIVINPATPDEHVRFENWRAVDDATLDLFKTMLKGNDLPTLVFEE